MNLHPDILEQYLTTHTSPQDPLLEALLRETFVKTQMPQMASGHTQGIFIEMLSRMLHPKRVLEIGTFTGYATICLARGLAAGGLLYTLDINEELESIFSKYFEQSGLASQIKFIAGNALETIPTIDEQFDLVFIDADKVNYARYYDLVIDRVRTGGYILTDNVLWSGKVLEREKDKDTQNIHLYNEKLRQDPRLQVVMVPIRDGISIARKL